MNWCSIKDCGRKFATEESLLSHMKRRHKDITVDLTDIRERNLKILMENNSSLNINFELIPRMKKINDSIDNSIKKRISEEKKISERKWNRRNI